MKYGSTPLLLLFMEVGIAAISPAAPLAGDASPERIKVYNVDSGITAPELLPAAFSVAAGATCSKDNKTVFTTGIDFIVDSEGQARNLYFAQATGTELDRIALRLASAEHFKPAVRDGRPVATWAVLETKFKVCAERKEVGGAKVVIYSLAAPPIQTLKQGKQSATEAVFAEIGQTDAPPPPNFKIGGGVTAPYPIVSPEAQFSDDARKKRISGSCLVSLTVDAQGMPQSLRVIRKLYPSLDQNALEAVSRYRFKPAMKGGLQPVPVTLTIEVNFRLH